MHFRLLNLLVPVFLLSQALFSPAAGEIRAKQQNSDNQPDGIANRSFASERVSLDSIFGVSSTTATPLQIESPILDPYRSSQNANSLYQLNPGHPQIPAPAATPKCNLDEPIARFRRGFLQGIQIQQGSLGGGNSETLSMHHVAAAVSVAVPLGSTDNLVVVTPNFRADLINAPAAMDVPDSLYETGVKFFWQKPVSESVGSMILVAPSIRSDFATTDNAFRIFGMAMLTWKAIPNELSLSAGVVYLDRSDYLALPGVGLLWTPNPRWKIDIQFPQPRVSYRVAKDEMRSESWVYLAGGFGGNTWAATRSGGISDELTISDIRMVLGFERIFAGNKGWFAEAGMAFARKYEYLKLGVENELDSASLIRGGITF